MKKLILLALIVGLLGANVVNCKETCTNSGCRTDNSGSGTEFDAEANSSTIETKRQEESTRTFDLCMLGICKTSIDSPEALASKIIKFMATLIGSFAFLAFMLGGFMLMVQLDDDGRAKGKSIMKNSIIAIIVTLSAYAIVSFVEQVILGLNK